MSADIARIRREHGLDIGTTDEQALRAVNSLRANLSNSLRNLSEELYTRDLHFVLEFVQNADDNYYDDGVTPTLDIKLEGRTIEIRCNETGFMPQNVQAICSVGKSTKKNLEGYIGEKGIGFKAVFTIASVVYVLSRNYSFKFDNTGREELGMIAPVWDTRYPVEPGWTTFRLVIPPRVDLDNLSLKLQEVEPSLLLFLRKLRELNVSINGHSLSLSRSDSEDGITVLRANQEEKRYVMVKADVQKLPSELKRPDVTKSEVVLAFPVSSTDAPIIADQDVHTFLPLRSFGFSFIIQADFLTTSNREDILSNRPWNSALRDAVPGVFVKAVESFNSRPELRYNWLQYVPCHVSNDFMKPIITGIKQRLRLRGTDGCLYAPAKLTMAPSEYQTESSEPLVPERYLGKQRYLAAGYNVSRDGSVLRHLGVKTMTADDFISALQSMGQEVKKMDRTWFERTCSALRSLANQWKSSYKARIRKLCVIPLEDGSWVAANTPDIFIVDTSITAIPEKLSMRLVRRNPSLSCEHSRLLEDLGVKSATSTEISNRILEYHRLYRQDKTVVLSHAKFLFQYSTLSSCPLDVRCDDDEVRDSVNVYMDYPFAQNKFPLSKMLKPYGAHFLHHQYYTVFPAGSSQDKRWYIWLSEAVAISIAPRFNGCDLCEEFWNFVEDPKSPVLEGLRAYWPLLSPKLSDADAVMRRLSVIRVLCSDKGHHPLNETYMGFTTLRKSFPDLLFVDLKNVQDHTWDFLASLGVTFRVNGEFYLKRLIERSRDPASSINSGEILRLYTHISARFDEDDNEDQIRKAFQDNAIIYIPPVAQDVDTEGPQAPGYWLSSKDVFWDGPRSVFSKIILASVGLYDRLQEFFSTQLRISSCPEEFLVEELSLVKERYGGRPLTTGEHQRVFDLLKDVAHAIPSEKTERKAKPILWLERLRPLAIFPANISVHDVRLCRAAKVYDPVGNTRLSDLFRGRVPLLAAPSGDSLGHIKTLLASEACDEVRVLCNEVHTDIKFTGTPRVDVSLSERYLTRLEALQCLALWKGRGPRSIVDLNDLIVYEVDQLSCQYTMGRLTTDEKPQALLISVDHDKRKVIIWRCNNSRDNNKEIDWDFECAIAFSSEWKINMSDVLMILSSSTENLERYLTMKGIPGLESQKGARRYRPPAPLPMQPQAQISTSLASSSVAKQNTDSTLSASPKNGDMVTRRALPPRGGSLVIPQEYSYETEWKTFIEDSDTKLRSAARHRSFASDIVDLQHGLAGLTVGASTYEHRNGESSEMERGGASPLSSNGHLASSLSEFSSFPGHMPKPNGRKYGGEGSRSETLQTGEDLMTGALGELYVFYVLSEELPDFTVNNWTSELRYYASGCKLERFTGVSKADFFYDDTEGKFTKILFGECDAVKNWATKYPRYHLEVKSTVGDKHAPFHVSRDQLHTATAMTIHDLKSAPADIYVLVRVWDLHPNDPSQAQLQAYPDPHKLLYDGHLRIESADGVNVVIQG